MSPKHLVVFRVLGEITNVCSLGYGHTVDVYSEKHLTLTDEVRVNNGVLGYSDSQQYNAVYRDAQGRRYDTYRTVDFGNSLIVRRREDSSRWKLRLLAKNEIRFDHVASA